MTTATTKSKLLSTVSPLFLALTGTSTVKLPFPLTRLQEKIPRYDRLGPSGDNGNVRDVRDVRDTGYR